MNSRYLLIVAVAIVAAGAGVAYHLHSRHISTGPVVHVENAFEFTAHGSYNVVAPLFGAWGERAWGGDHWKPQFLYPQPARDVPGEVFTVAHSHLRSTWVNTALDFDSGHIQYVYVIPDAQAVLIDIHLQQHDPSATDVKVVYQRTALNADFNAHVTKLREEDRNSAQEWQTAIDKYLQGK